MLRSFLSFDSYFCVWSVCEFFLADFRAKSSKMKME